MNFPLFKLTLKKNWVLFLIFLGVLTMYTTIMASMYDPDDMAGLMSMFELLPPEIMNALGFAGVFTDVTGFLASWLYGLLMIAFPMVYSIILSNNLIAKMVDSGSMACLLSMPVSRTKIAVTRGIYALCSVAVLQMLIFAIGTITCELLFSDSLQVGAFFRLNVTAMLVNMTVMSITYFFSCLFNDTKYSVGFGAGIPITFLLLNMLGGASSDAEILKKLSIFGWYDPVKLVNGASSLGVNLIYLTITLLLFIAGVIIFNRKRLPI